MGQEPSMPLVHQPFSQTMHVMQWNCQYIFLSVSLHSFSVYHIPVPASLESLGTLWLLLLSPLKKLCFILFKKKFKLYGNYLQLGIYAVSDWPTERPKDALVGPKTDTKDDCLITAQSLINCAAVHTEPDKLQQYKASALLITK